MSTIHEVKEGKTLHQFIADSIVDQGYKIEKYRWRTVGGVFKDNIMLEILSLDDDRCGNCFLEEQHLFSHPSGLQGVKEYIDKSVFECMKRIKGDL